MPVEIKVPSMGESVVEATIAQWLKNPGDPVKAGDEIVELETEKVNQSIEAESDGVLTEVRKKAGETVGVGEVLAILSENGAGAPVSAARTAESAPSAPPTPAGDSGVKATPVAATMAAQHGVDLSSVKPSREDGRVGKNDVQQQIAAPTPTVAPTSPVTPPPVATPPPPPPPLPGDRKSGSA